jgi:lipopolysaccharide heptosyltransferase II
MRTPLVTPNVYGSLDSRVAERAALGMLIKLSARKRLFIRALDLAVRPLVRALNLLFPFSVEAVRDVNRILVIEYWNLGDIVMLTPFLRSLRIQYPKAHISLLTSPKAAPILEQQGLVDDVIVVRTPWAQHYSRLKKYNPFSFLWVELLRTLRLLRGRQIDLAFVARADIRDKFMVWFIRAKRRVGYSLGGGAYFLTEIAVPDLRDPHQSNQWLGLLPAVGMSPIVREPRLQITPEEQQVAEQILSEHGIQTGDILVGIHPGARTRIRQWGEDNFLAVAKRLQLESSIKIIWFLDPGQKAMKVGSIRGCSVSLPLRQFMGVLARCRMLICNDSGPMHLATALQVPVVAVFGPGEPAWFGPRGQNNRIVIQPGFWCRPCLDYCLFDQPYCLRTITVESVFQTAAELLSVLSANAGRCSELIEHAASKVAPSD